MNVPYDFSDWPAAEIVFEIDPNADSYAAIHEAELNDYPTMTLYFRWVMFPDEAEAVRFVCQFSDFIIGDPMHRPAGVPVRPAARVLPKPKLPIIRIGSTREVARILMDRLRAEGGLDSQ